MIFCFVTQISGLLQEPGTKYHNCLQVKGCLFDSAPGKRRILNAVKAFMTTLHSTPYILRGIFGFCTFIYLFVIRFMLGWLPGIGYHQGFSLFQKMCEDTADYPHMFLYSKTDVMIPYYDVEELAQVREDQGVVVKRLCWEDSDHVAHLRSHPEVYTKACQDFVRSCMNPPMAG